MRRKPGGAQTRGRQRMTAEKIRAQRSERIAGQGALPGGGERSEREKEKGIWQGVP